MLSHHRHRRNDVGCVECHQSVDVGAFSQTMEFRAGHITNGAFVDAPGGQLIHARGTDSDIVEHISTAETVKAFTAIATAEPSCAMAYWGIAMSQRPNPLVPPFSKELLKGGWQAIEKARQEKLIGNALEAAVVLQCDERLANAVSREELEEFFILSDLKLEPAKEPSASVSRTPNKKCARCWRHRSTVGTIATHPDLCDRCAAVMESRA